MLKKLCIFIAGSLFLAFSAFAQSNEAAVSFGAALSPSVNGLRGCDVLPFPCPAFPSSDSVETGFTFLGAYSHRLRGRKYVSVHLELPVMLAPSRRVDTSPRFNPDFSSFFFTPALQMRFLPSSGISPFISAGYGLAHYSDQSGSDTKFASQLGGGLNFKTRLPLLGFRVEVRDFITGRPGTPSFTSVTSDHLHSIFLGGGVTLHF